VILGQGLAGRQPGPRFSTSCGQATPSPDALAQAPELEAWKQPGSVRQGLFEDAVVTAAAPPTLELGTVPRSSRWPGPKAGGKVGTQFDGRWPRSLSRLSSPVVARSSSGTGGRVSRPQGIPLPIKVVATVGTAISRPVVVWHIWSFITPGLIRLERRPFGSLPPLRLPWNCSDMPSPSVPEQPSDGQAFRTRGGTSRWRTTVTRAAVLRTRTIPATSGLGTRAGGR
jgi:hypothetical protein